MVRWAYVFLSSLDYDSVRPQMHLSHAQLRMSEATGCLNLTKFDDQTHSPRSCSRPPLVRLQLPGAVSAWRFFGWRSIGQYGSTRIDIACPQFWMIFPSFPEKHKVCSKRCPDALANCSSVERFSTTSSCACTSGSSATNHVMARRRSAPMNLLGVSQKARARGSSYSMSAGHCFDLETTLVRSIFDHSHVNKSRHLVPQQCNSARHSPLASDAAKQRQSHQKKPKVLSLLSRSCKRYQPQSTTRPTLPSFWFAEHHKFTSLQVSKFLA